MTNYKQTVFSIKPENLTMNAIYKTVPTLKKTVQKLKTVTDLNLRTYPALALTASSIQIWVNLG